MNTIRLNNSINSEYDHPLCEAKKEEIDLQDSYAIFSQVNFSDKIEHESLQNRVKILNRTKSKEAEDKTTNRILQRNSSQPRILSSNEKIELEEQACKDRDGFLWECKGRIPSPFGGYIYKYKIRKEYNNVNPPSSHDLLKNEQNIHLKNQELFPAVEMAPGSIPHKIGLDNALSPLGYNVWLKAGSVFMQMPDREALLGAYQNLKEKYPEKNLPDIDIASSEGTADDLSFSVQHFKGGLLSTGSEFCHDHHFHIIPRIKRALEGIDSYQETEKFLVGHVFSKYRMIYMAQTQNPSLIEHSERLNFHLGILTDSLFSHYPIELVVTSQKLMAQVIQFLRNLGNSITCAMTFEKELL